MTWAAVKISSGGADAAVTGEGRWHAIFGALGMVVGAGLYAEMYPFYKVTVLSWADFGKIGLPEAIGVNHWVIAAVLAVSFGWLFRWFERKGL